MTETETETYSYFPLQKTGQRETGPRQFERILWIIKHLTSLLILCGLVVLWHVLVRCVLQLK